jgi:hypothetical protein
MPEPRDIPLARWGESLRWDCDERRTLRFRLVLTAAVAILVTALFMTLVWPPRPALVWKACASAPIGVYRVEAPLPTFQAYRDQLLARLARFMVIPAILCGQNRARAHP